MNPFIAIVDYGMGNLRSVQKALEKAGAHGPRITDSAGVMSQADAVVLPGVGAFGEAIRRLKIQRLLGPLTKFLEKDKPFLGICLGLQLLFEDSEENPRIPGIGFFKGSVQRFKPRKTAGLKVPHMGWNTLHFAGRRRPSYFEGIGPGDYFYFVHSYFPAPKESQWVVTTTDYGQRFCSSVAKGSLFASQFHPEKSGRQGLQLLRNFVRLVKTC